ncbi:MAG: AAA family ATPase [Desulfobacteraceae bacterium]|nr:AAA family ATPase [Desulfobacteraceae bacterium]
MSETYRTFFGLSKEAFPANIDIDEILVTPEVQGVKNRFDYAVRLGSSVVITGDVGSGKSTALRYAASSLHPSEYKVFYVTATTGSIIELYRQIVEELGVEKTSISRAIMMSTIKNEIKEFVQGKKMKTVLIIDEASLLRMEVFAELHTLVQFERDSRTWLPVILAGQPTLVDKLQYRTSIPFASRVVAKSHLEGLDMAGMRSYLIHHLKLCGVDTNFFSDQAITAIHQGSGGLLRKANHLARGSLIAAAIEKSMSVSAEHVRIASSEIF